MYNSIESPLCDATGIENRYELLESASNLDNSTEQTEQGFQRQRAATPMDEPHSRFGTL
jgi:hypothetical protein